MTDLEIREFRATPTADEATVEGIAVPYGETISVGGFRERFAPGAAEGSEGVKLFWRHDEIIGAVDTLEDREDGLFIRARIADTTLGRDARALLKLGAIDRFSVGFIPVEDREDEDGTIVRTKVALREVSLVPHPAYSGATVTQARAALEDVRSDSAANPDNNERSDMTDTNVAAEVDEIRGSIEELSREVRSLATVKDETPAVDNRSAGEILQGIVRGDETAIRAYEGGTTDNAPMKAGWVGDLTRIFDNSSGVLSQIFGQGTLPAAGMSIEYAELATNTMSVTEQADEGEALAQGQVTLTTKTAPVKTYGGGTSLSRQAIERSNLPVLNRSLEALAQAAGVRKKLEMRAAFNALVAARVTAEDVIDIAATPSAYDWADAVIDAAINLESKGAGIDALVVSTDVFKTLVRLESDGHRLFRIDGAERTVGELDLTGLVGDVAGVKVVADTAASAGSAAFVNARAIRQYDSAVVNLSDEDIVTLTRDFSVYRYGAVAAEIPGFVVPVEFAGE